ncbi:DUF421 domain-containing protein [Lutispora sp.]|uniref:DUF421 domain-containing protein n=1 Tax=Lutispora sp. TaxID=2828727 RepID=UPI0035645BB1
MPSKATVGVFAIATGVLIIGWISLNKKFYNVDSRAVIVIANGKIDKEALRTYRINLPFLLSMLRIKGYPKVSDVEFAIIEPDGSLSVVPKSQSRPVTPKDLNIDTQYEGLALPLIIDGEIQDGNLKYANLDRNWLQQELKKVNISNAKEVFLAELDTQGKLYIDLYKDNNANKPPDI